MYFKNIDFRIVLDEWLKSKEKIVKQSTYLKYDFIINKYLISYFKNFKIKNIKNKDILIFQIVDKEVYSK